VTDSISILIIEGEPNLRGNLASALTEVGFIVAVVRDYPEALLKIDEFKPDIAIVDEALSNRAGREACYQLHSALGIPVIVLGEDSSEEVWERVTEVEADLYLIKPFSYRELVARIKAILRRYKKAAGGDGCENRNKGF